MNGRLTVCLLSFVCAAAVWIAACVRTPTTVDEPSGEPASPSTAKTPPASAPVDAADAQPRRPEATEAATDLDDERAPEEAVQESLVTLLYTVNNMGYTGACG